MSSRAPGPTDQICVGEAVCAREFDGEWVLLDLAGGKYFGLDEVGGAIWHELAVGRSVGEVATTLAQSYEMSEAVILRDILTLVDDLVEHGLVTVKDGDGG